jgi:hypothetical protein
MTFRPLGCWSADVALDMSVAMSLAWHVFGCLRRFGERDRSTGLTPGHGRWRHVFLPGYRDGR